MIWQNEKSERERIVAKLLLERGFYPEACFHSHMAVELKLKGILVQNTGSIIYTHSLKRLIEEVKKIKNVEVDNEIMECATYLSTLYTGSRYPEESLVDLDKSEGEKCVRCMERLLSTF
ncbi:HEPN domain-containing protein [Sulfurisphaera javensis]